MAGLPSAVALQTTGPILTGTSPAKRGILHGLSNGWNGTLPQTRCSIRSSEEVQVSKNCRDLASKATSHRRGPCAQPHRWVEGLQRSEGAFDTP
jgi:hypothetical protein